jgi:hypothetical protein
VNFTTAAHHRLISIVMMMLMILWEPRDPLPLKGPSRRVPSASTNDRNWKAPIIDNIIPSVRYNTIQYRERIQNHG